MRQPKILARRAELRSRVARLTLSRLAFGEWLGWDRGFVGTRDSRREWHLSRRIAVRWSWRGVLHDGLRFRLVKNVEGGYEIKHGLVDGGCDCFCGGGGARRGLDSGMSQRLCRPVAVTIVKHARGGTYEMEELSRLPF